MTLFFDRYKNLFIEDQSFIRKRAKPSWNKHSLFQYRLKSIEDKINNKYSTAPKYYTPNPEYQYQHQHNSKQYPKVGRTNVHLQARPPPIKKNYQTLIPETSDINTHQQNIKPEKQIYRPNRSLLKLPPIQQHNQYMTQSRSDRQRCKTQFDIYYTPQINKKYDRDQQRGRVRSDSVVFVQCAPYKSINNFQLLDKRMCDIRKINNYHDMSRLNQYTSVLLRRRQMKKDPKRKAKLHHIFVQQQQQARVSQIHPNFHYSKL